MSYKLKWMYNGKASGIRSAEIYKTDSAPCAIRQNGATYNGVTYYSATYPTLRDLFDAASKRFGNIVLFVEWDGLANTQTLRIAGRLPKYKSENPHITYSPLVRETPSGTWYSNDLVKYS